jgi:predicted metal-dependent peptidase
MEAGNLPGWASQLVDAILATPSLPWQTILKRFLTRNVPIKNSYLRPSRRAPWMRNPIMPGKAGKTLGRIAILVDTSGSMGDEVLDLILSEIRSLLTQFPETEVIVVQYDTQVHSVERFGKGKALAVKKWEWKGRGGTSYRLAFDYANKLAADCIIMATDGFPNDGWPLRSAVRVPVMWAMTTEEKAPWGTTIRVQKKGQ